MIKIIFTFINRMEKRSKREKLSTKNGKMVILTGYKGIYNSTK